MKIFVQLDVMRLQQFNFNRGGQPPSLTTLFIEGFWVKEGQRHTLSVALKGGVLEDRLRSVSNKELMRVTKLAANAKKQSKYD